MSAISRMYEPMSDGEMRPVAVEHISSRGRASLEGHLFNLANSPDRCGLAPFHERHVRAWKDKPRGAFTDMNPM